MDGINLISAEKILSAQPHNGICTLLKITFAHCSIEHNKLCQLIFFQPAIVEMDSRTFFSLMRFSKEPFLTAVLTTPAGAGMPPIVR